MNKEIADKWVEALRSGKYKQTSGFLCRVFPDGKESYCCLGVLCDILGTPNEITKLANAKAYDGKYNYLPESVVEKCDLKTSRGVIAHMSSNLSQINDRGESFTTIADIIEKNWERL